MDGETYDQYTLDPETVGDQVQWLEPGMNFQAEWLNGRPIAIELPAVAELEVIETAPVMKTATKTASTKPATLYSEIILAPLRSIFACLRTLLLYGLLLHNGPMSLQPVSQRHSLFPMMHWLAGRKSSRVKLS